MPEEDDEDSNDEDDINSMTIDNVEKEMLFVKITFRELKTGTHILSSIEPNR